MALWIKSIPLDYPWRCLSLWPGLISSPFPHVPSLSPGMPEASKFSLEWTSWSTFFLYLGNSSFLLQSSAQLLSPPNKEGYLSMQLIHSSIVTLTHIHLYTSLQSHGFTTPYLLGSIWSWRPCPVFFVSLESSPMTGGTQWEFDEWINEWTITWTHDLYHKMLYDLIIKTEQIHTNDARPLMLRAKCQISETNDQTYSIRGKSSFQL